MERPYPAPVELRSVRRSYLVDEQAGRARADEADLVEQVRPGVPDPVPGVPGAGGDTRPLAHRGAPQVEREVRVDGGPPGQIEVVARVGGEVRRPGQPHGRGRLL